MRIFSIFDKNMTINILDKLHESGELRNLVHSGLISPNVILWRKIYHSYQLEILKGHVKTQAVENVSIVFGVDTRTVYRILKRMKC